MQTGETIAYGYWLVKFIESGEGLGAWEYAKDATEFVRGDRADYAALDRTKHTVCMRVGARFDPAPTGSSGGAFGRRP
jgi:hypothetical protein